MVRKKFKSKSNMQHCLSPLNPPLALTAVLSACGRKAPSAVSREPLLERSENL